MRGQGVLFINLVDLILLKLGVEEFIVPSHDHFEATIQVISPTEMLLSCVDVFIRSGQYCSQQSLGLCRLTPSRGECEMKGHYLKTRLVDHCLVNNKVMLGQETQYTYQSTKVWLK